METRMRQNPSFWIFTTTFAFLFFSGCGLRFNGQSSGSSSPITTSSASAGVLSLLAGSIGGPGSMDGTGSSARFLNAYGSAVDSSGNVFIADCGNHTIRKITAAGDVTTVAGTAGLKGYLDGTGSAARFNCPYGVAVDASGEVFVADSNNDVIRKISPAGVVTTLAGTAGVSGSTDGTGSAARFSRLYGISVDSSGNVYAADNNAIRKITSAGVVTTLAGVSGTMGEIDGTGSAAKFSFPTGTTVDSSGNVYVADWLGDTIRKITPAGVVTTLAGSAGLAGSTDATGAAARFSYPYGVAVDGSGTLYVADTGNNTIRKVTSAGVVTTLAGTAGSWGFTDGTGAAARFNYPMDIAVDSSGNLYVADTNNFMIRKVTALGVVSTLAGLAGYGSVDGTGSAARFGYPYGIAVDSAGNAYVADSTNDTIRKIDSSGGVTTLAGAAGIFGSTDGTGAAARFYFPTAIAVDSSDNLYVADGGNNTIRKVTSAGVVTTLAGTAGSWGSTDGTGAAAKFSLPYGIAVDSSGTVYVADTFNDTIRKITPAGVVTTFAGSAWAGGSTDGTGSAARFNSPNGITVDSSGNLYVTDTNNETIRKITPAGVVTTLAGTVGVSGATNGTGSAARFNSPNGITVDSLGNLYVADTFNNTIREITPAGVVTTLVGTGIGSAGIFPGDLPGSIITPEGVAEENGKLFMTTSSAILTVF